MDIHLVKKACCEVSCLLGCLHELKW